MSVLLTCCTIIIIIYLSIYLCILYLGQQFGQRFRRLARLYDPLKDGNSFHDVRYIWRKTWMPFSTRSRRFFQHVDDSFSGTPCHLDRLPILVLAELITFEPFNKHMKHSSGSRKTRGHSGHLLKGRKRRGGPGSFFGESGVISYVLKHLSLIILTYQLLVFFPYNTFGVGSKLR